MPDSDEAAHEQMENFFGPLKVIRGALPTLRSQKSGCIVNITSVAAFDGLPTCSLYARSKFALEAWFLPLW
jgi:short-subunit dehydrogenase